MGSLNDDTLTAASAILRSLATSSNGDSPKGAGPVMLPGPTSSAKRQLEAELSSLVGRVSRLEQKANIINHQTLPVTPNEIGAPSPFADVLTGGQKKHGSSRQHASNSVLGSPSDERPQKVAKVGDESLPETAFEKVLDQAAQIQHSKQECEMLRQSLVDIQSQHKQKNREEVMRVETLERELKKHQQANEAFQKALREIGEIVTAVAKGDLSKKVLIHAKELDPEISKFKKASQFYFCICTFYR
jgi:osomolarity two-component system sensor histidine kinase NIK1